MPDVTRMLEKDHRTVEKLFQRFTTTPSVATAHKICEELRTHTALEEEIVYPVLRAEVDKSMAREAEKEHREAKQLIARIMRIRSVTAQLESLVEELEGAINHHVEEEESEVFPKMRRELGSELTTMGTEMQTRKRQIVGGAPAAGRSGRTTTTRTRTGTTRTRRASAGGRRPTTAGRGQKAPTIDLTRDELLAKARRAGVTGFSRMTKQELVRALSRTGSRR